MGTILVSKVSAELACQFGELIADVMTNELLHYTEKPEILGVSAQRKERANLRRISSLTLNRSN